MTGRIEGLRAEVTGHGARAVVTGSSASLGADRVSTRALDRHALAHDASHYLLVPAVVARPEDADQVAAVMRACDRAGTPLTFRAGGTSLSGQAVTDGVLVDVRRHFRGVEVLDDGARVRVQPGTTVAAVNARLRPLGRRLGPDPASEFACTVGGVVANNSSGMQCGTEPQHLRHPGVACRRAAHRRRPGLRARGRRRAAAARRPGACTPVCCVCGTGSAMTPGRCAPSAGSSR